MKTIRNPIPTLILLLTLFWLAAPGQAAEKTRVLVVTGGHGFETNQFFKMFQDNPDITFQAAEHPKAHAWLKTEAARQWDVLVLYDMWQPITDEAKSDFVARLKEGKGLVALHHCLASHQKWPEYAKIIGGQYHLEKWVQDGAEKPGSTYLHDVKFKVKVADPTHPVTRGLQDFDIQDETYGGFEVKPESHALLTTEEKTSSPTIAWAKTYEAARVVYVELGHDHFAFENPNYRRLVAQAIRWTAKRD
ncbi:MAG: ThuA domain-containing protein [Verrucomicrobiota bacterium]